MIHWVHHWHLLFFPTEPCLYPWSGGPRGSGGTRRCPAVRWCPGPQIHSYCVHHLHLLLFFPTEPSGGAVVRVRGNTHGLPLIVFLQSRVRTLWSGGPQDSGGTRQGQPTGSDAHWVHHQHLLLLFPAEPCSYPLEWRTPRLWWYQTGPSSQVVSVQEFSEKDMFQRSVVSSPGNNAGAGSIATIGIAIKNI